MKTNYLNSPYAGSIAQKAVLVATPEQLQRRRLYTLAAIDYHRTQGNREQANFFLQDLKLIDNRLNH